MVASVRSTIRSSVPCRMSSFDSRSPALLWIFHMTLSGLMWNVNRKERRTPWAMALSECGDSRLESIDETLNPMPTAIAGL